MNPSNDDRLPPDCREALETGGVLIVIVGPSGSGKDSLLAEARRALAGHPRLHIVRRVITRPVDAGHEPHESVSNEEFTLRRDRGGFAMHWQAHGLHYGVPADVLELLAAGKVVLLNGSRAALPEMQARFPRMLVVSVVVDPLIREQRLQQRGREHHQDVQRRLSRSVSADVLPPGHVEIDNSGTLSEASARFAGLLEHWLEDPHAADTWLEIPFQRKQLSPRSHFGMCV